MAAEDALTLDETKIALGIEGTDQDENLARLITAITLEVERRLRTQFIIRAVTERHEGGSKHIYLQCCPIVAVSTFSDPKGNTVAADQYVVRQQRWLEHYSCFWFAYATTGQVTDWTIVYTAGWFASVDLVARDVKKELLAAIVSVMEAPSAGVDSIRVGDLSINYVGREGASPVSLALDGAAANLWPYRGVLL